MDIQRIKLSTIDYNDTSFNLNPFGKEPPPEKLLKSIAKQGIIQPPIIQQANHGQYIIISGQKRLVTAQTLNHSSCQCRVIPSDHPPQEIWDIIFADMIFQPEISVVSQCFFFKKASKWYDKQQLAARFLPALNRKANIFFIDQFLAVANLEENIIMALHQKQLDLKVAIKLTELRFSERMVIFDLICKLNLSVSNQKKILDTGKELASRNKTSIQAIFSSPEFIEIFRQPADNIPQKTTKLMAWLNKEKFPMASAAEEEFTNFTKNLNLPKNMTVQHSPYFEKDLVQLIITFKNKDKLVDYLK